MSKTAPLVE